MHPEIRNNLIRNGALPEELAALDAIQAALDARHWFQTERKLGEPRHDLLWDILSALRGPDGGTGRPDTELLKDRTTVRLRGAVFSASSFPAFIRPWESGHTIELKETDQSPHFRGHIVAACKALGIRCTLNGVER